ncbi:hypothetical protein PaecuDRAFT_4472 [Paenibacillus curdlanolyticus YK9]|uniref:Uncharacterized protein n=1 Tax=Paenibacillus curdlanolyticus YK9 TaxID=717606 RepID=E0IFL2_9BACL|nr:hypothetical protein [Paenibacillus curdlanolyticus]EFM08678.1 hypothetical protein PaecuDRAFT_4472 [Paenibacillus curdlanolyticus YK9]
MRFFSDELLHQSIFEETKETEEQWNQALHNYCMSLELLKGKVSKPIWDIAYHNRLHDAKFAGIVIQHGENQNRPTHIEVSFQKGKAIQIQYRKVSKFVVTFNEADTGIDHLGIDDCVYSELLEVGEKLFSHELLFSSGAKFYIEFEKISLRR